MTVFGQIKLLEFLEKRKGAVRGSIFTDAKYRTYSEDYMWKTHDDGYLTVSRKNGTGDRVKVRSNIDLDESLVSFFGLYSGDGSKGSERPENPGVLVPSISFSQREPNLVLFAYHQFKRIFSDSVHFKFCLGEDGAYFMGGDGYEMLCDYFDGHLPDIPPLAEVRPKLNDRDERYLGEKRSVTGTNEEHLAFYYFFKAAMQKILTAIKAEAIEGSGIELGEEDSVTASLRRPFKKGAREPGGSSRSDEMYVGGLNGFGQIFLTILHEIEQSIFDDKQSSDQGLIHWSAKPSELGETIDTKHFFKHHNFGIINAERPEFNEKGPLLFGQWPRSRQLQLSKRITLDPLFCYVAGLYLAEGSTPKSKMFSMFRERVTGLSLSFTSSEDVSLGLVLRSLQKLFKKDDCLCSWKIKVGNQYFPELVVIGLKEGVPMLRGGNKGEGKLRTMEISLSLKEWARDVAPSLEPFLDRYSHVEPTGSGLARIDFSSSSTLCKWYFPLIMYATFGLFITNPVEEFVDG